MVPVLEQAARETTTHIHLCQRSHCQRQPQRSQPHLMRTLGWYRASMRYNHQFMPAFPSIPTLPTTKHSGTLEDEIPVLPVPKYGDTGAGEGEHPQPVQIVPPFGAPPILGQPTMPVSGALESYSSFPNSSDSDPEMRMLGVKLAHGLASYAGKSALPPITQRLSDGYIAETRAYARAVATRRPQLLLQLITTTADIVNSSDLPLSESMINCILQILSPWFKRIDKLTDRRVAGAISVIFDRLWEITPTLAKNDIFVIQLESLWSAFATDITAVSLVSFIASKLKKCESENMNMNENNQCEYDVASFAIRAIGRASPRPLRSVIEHLIRDIRNYKEYTVDAEAYLHHGFSFSQEEEGNTQQNHIIAFRLVTELAREHGTELIPYLSLVLHNSIIMIGSANSVDSVLGNNMLAHLIASISHSTKNLEDEDQERTDALDFIAEFLYDPVTGAIPTQPAKSFPPPWTEVLTELTSTYRPNIGKEWTEIGLNWALQPFNPEMSRRSLLLIPAITPDDVLESHMIPRVMQIIAVALRNGDRQTCEAGLNVFLLPMSKKESTNSSETYITQFTQAAITLLHFPWTSVRDLAGKLLQRVLEHGSENENCVVEAILSSLPDESSGNRGQAIADLFLPLIYGKSAENDTQRNALQVLYSLVRVICKRLRPEENLVLMGACCVVLGMQGMAIHAEAEAESGVILDIKEVVAENQRVLDSFADLLTDSSEVSNLIRSCSGALQMLAPEKEMNEYDASAFITVFSKSLFAIYDYENTGVDYLATVALDCIDYWKRNLFHILRKVLIEGGVLTDALIERAAEVSYMICCNSEAAEAEPAVELMVELDRHTHSGIKRAPGAVGLFDFLEQDPPPQPQGSDGLIVKFVVDEGLKTSTIDAALKKILIQNCQISREKAEELINSGLGEE